MASDEVEKNRIGLILAVVAGLLALGLSFIFLKKMRDDTVRSLRVQSNFTTQTVLAAARDLPAGHLISSGSDLQAITIPVSAETEKFAANCIVAEHAPELEGRKLGVALAANLPIFYGHLVVVQPLDEKFTEGFLKTISLAKESFFSSHLMPGDRVDVLVTRPKKNPAVEKIPPVSGANGTLDPSAMIAAAMAPLLAANNSAADFETLTILENVEVFMVGTQISGGRQQFGFFDEENSTDEVTFRLSKENALLLTNYEHTNDVVISLLLRPRNTANQ